MKQGAILALIGMIAGSPALAECSSDSASIRGAFGSARFDVALADDPQERARGLMFVEEMGAMEGMIFAYERPQSVSFWMRNTLIPLDMLFIDSSGTVTHIHENALPLDETPIFGGRNVQFVLEINGGMVGRLGLSVGDVLQHPVIGSEAEWPCSQN